MDDPTPLLSAQLLSHGVEKRVLGPARTWDFAPLLEELVASVPANGSSQATIALSGTFGGTPPGLGISPETVRRLARASVCLSLVLRVDDAYVPSSAAATRRRPLTHVRFFVSGLFEPDEFTRRVHVVPTRTTRRDQSRRLKARVSTWDLSAAQREAEEFPPTATDDLLTVLGPVAQEITSAVATLGVRSAVRYTASVEEAMPPLRLSASQVAGIADLQCWLDVGFLRARENDTFIEF